MGELTPKKARPMAMADDNFYPEFPTPFPLLERFFSSPLNRLADALFGDFGINHNPDHIYKADDGKWVIQVSLPGVAEDDVKVATDGRILTVTVDSSDGEEDEGKSRYSRNYYRRAWSLPQEVDGDPEVELHRGVLTVSWSCKDRTRLIPVKRGGEKE